VENVNNRKRKGDEDAKSVIESMRGSASVVYNRGGPVLGGSALVF
jgi:hypothetical protein